MKFLHYCEIWLTFQAIFLPIIYSEFEYTQLESEQLSELSDEPEEIQVMPKMAVVGMKKRTTVKMKSRTSRPLMRTAGKSIRTTRRLIRTTRIPGGLHLTTAVKRKPGVQINQNSPLFRTTTIPQVTHDFCDNIDIDALLLTSDKHVYIFNGDFVVKMNLQNKEFVKLAMIKDFWREVETPIDSATHVVGTGRNIVFFKENKFWVYGEQVDYSSSQKLLYRGYVETTFKTMTFQSIEWQAKGVAKLMLCSENNEPMECGCSITKMNGTLLLNTGNGHQCYNHSSSVYDCNVDDYIEYGDIAYLILVNDSHVSFIDTRDNDYTYNIEKDIYKCKEKTKAPDTTVTVSDDTDHQATGAAIKEDATDSPGSGTTNKRKNGTKQNQLTFTLGALLLLLSTIFTYI